MPFCLISCSEMNAEMWTANVRIVLDAEVELNSFCCIHIFKSVLGIKKCFYHVAIILLKQCLPERNISQSSLFCKSLDFNSTGSNLLSSNYELIMSLTMSQSSREKNTCCFFSILTALIGLIMASN